MDSNDICAKARCSTKSMDARMMRRLMPLAITLIGVAVWVAALPTHVEVGPLPGQNLKVRLNVEVRFAGNYFVEVSMPKVANAQALGPLDVIKCDFSVVIARAGIEMHSQHIGSMNRGTDNGWSYTQQYVGGPSFRLNRGTYDATISTGAGCPDAAARGASVSIARQYSEHIAGSLLLNIFAWALILVGILGQIILDVKRAPTH
jgi:hypothetical protein